MRLKYQLLLLGFLSLLFPLTGWIALKSVDKEFRYNIEQAANNTLMSLKASVQQLRQNIDGLHFNGLIPSAIDNYVLDGDDAEWQDVPPYLFKNKLQKLSVKLAIHQSKMLLYIESNDTSKNIAIQESNTNDHIIIAVANNRKVSQFKVQRQAEGIVTSDHATPDQPSYTAYWHEKSKGYAVELELQLQDFHHFGIASVNKIKFGHAYTSINTGTLENNKEQTLKLLPLISLNQTFSQAINEITPTNNQFSLRDSNNRILYQSNKLPNNPQVSSWQWIITPIYQWLFSIDNNSKNNWFYQEDNGMAGVKQEVVAENIHYQLISMMPQGQQSMIQTLLKAGVLMMAVVVLLMSAYLLYSLVLAWRIKNLNRAMQTVLDDSGQLHIQMPSHGSRDEIGQLSRGIESMLIEMREYTHYLKDLGSRLSHEMKTPLAIVQSSLDNLEMDPDPAFLYRAQEGTKRLRFILNQLSELTQLKYTLEQTPKQKLDLVALVGELTQSYLCFIPQLKTHFDPAPLYVNGSADLIAQLVDKLMDNAKDFISKNGFIAISVIKNKETIALRIFNTDSQLPEKGLNIFDSLVSIRSQKSKDSIHMGLGLHLVQLIARYHEAKITAENAKKPKGVVFTIEFTPTNTI